MSDEDDFMQDSDQEEYVSRLPAHTLRLMMLTVRIDMTLNTKTLMMMKLATLELRINTTMRSR